MPGPSEMVLEELACRLGRVDPDRIVLVGVGNRLRGDDAAGPLLIDTLQGSPLHLVDAGTVPEEYTSLIKRLNPQVIGFLDALDHGGTPGTVRVIEPDQVLSVGGYSHTLSLDLIMDYLKEETGADVFLIGIQFGEIGAEPGLSPGMETSIRDSAELIRASISGGAGRDPVSWSDPLQHSHETEDPDQTDQGTV